MNPLDREEFAIAACIEAGKLALDYFAKGSALIVDQKGAQDWVSEADRNVERFLRQRISEAWPTDGIYGEEYDPLLGESGFDWVIDPIDGTTNFVNGIPAWTIVLACVADGKTRIGAIHDPISNETFVASQNCGSRLNGAKIQVANVSLDSGTVAVGYSNRVDAMNVIPVIAALLERGAMFHRNASGALSLAYVASGRLLGYMEEHMNAWDCLAGQLLIEEAGGRVEDQDAGDMIRKGGRVIAGAPQVFEELILIADAAWSG